MTHHITAVIGSPSLLARLVDEAGCPAPTELPSGLAIVPLGHSQIDKLTNLEPGSRVAGFDYLSTKLRDVLSAIADSGKLAYVETNYFGGTGSQAAAAFANGALTVSASIPISQRAAQRDDPINNALKALGVRATLGLDEFDTLGLGRFRTLEALGLDDWEDD